MSSPSALPLCRNRTEVGRQGKRTRRVSALRVLEELIGKTLVEVSPDFYRPTDVVNLWGDPTKAKAKLNWNPNTTSFEDLVKIMVESDMAKVAAEDAGQKVRCNLAEYLEKGIVK